MSEPRKPYSCYCFLAPAAHEGLKPGELQHSPRCLEQKVLHEMAQRDACAALGHTDPNDGEVCSACCEHCDLDCGICIDCGEDRSEYLAAKAYDLYRGEDV